MPSFISLNQQPKKQSGEEYHACIAYFCCFSISKRRFRSSNEGPSYEAELVAEAGAAGCPPCAGAKPASISQLPDAGPGMANGCGGGVYRGCC
eukprot:m.252522 g.252522  ORF g.252522 m.252522 type:complete len:93 (+) comp54525_c0_seq1:57-335(+)